MRHPRHPHHHDSPFGGRHWEKGWFGGPPWGGGHRARRGDVRTALLSLLADKSMHGYDLIRELEQRSGGAWRPSPGSILVTNASVPPPELACRALVFGKLVESVKPVT